jgi:hypothetical protein
MGTQPCDHAAHRPIHRSYSPLTDASLRGKHDQRLGLTGLRQHRRLCHHPCLARLACELAHRPHLSCVKGLGSTQHSQLTAWHGLLALSGTCGTMTPRRTLLEIK